jgi:diguanylate cyclase (GGDEF)-like protein
LTSFDQFKFARKFLIGSGIVITLAICAIFFVFNMRAERLTISVIHQQAKSLFNQVILLRRWITGHGGVYVEVRPGVTPNPFLTSLPGLKVNIIDPQDGRQYTLRNPGLATREMSQISSQAEGYSFRISSLKPVNTTTNSPDGFERDALLRFEQGAREVFAVEQGAAGPVYRYMAPLIYETSCNRCHSHQGYQNGDIRGGVSVSIPMEEVATRMRSNRLLTLGSAISVLVLLLGSLAVIIQRFMQALREAQSKLVEMAVMDALTGLLNRRAGLERVEEELSRQHRTGGPVACLLMDIDHFKKINDTFGHLAGDEVLAQIGRILAGATRKHDIASRYGGEEFLLLLPDTELPAALNTAEKIRAMTAGLPFVFAGRELNVTTSVGVTMMKQHENIESLIARADQALYQAKSEGRNRVCCLETPI